jgi:Mycothiol maleylpyruvate isomerase N-terminal domain
VRELFGHTTRAFLTIEQYLGQDPDGEVLASAAVYFRRSFESDPTIHEAIAARGRQSAAAVGDDPVAAAQVLCARVQALVDQTPDDALVALPSGSAMEFATYLETRVCELVLHGIDLEDALGLEPIMPAGPVALVAEIMVDLIDRLDDRTVLRLLTGRTRGRVRHVLE